MTADPPVALGRLRIWYPQVTSTMDAAAGLALAGAPHGTLVEAALQTAGRGRMGRSWHAPAGSGFLGSWLLRGPAGGDLHPLSPACAAAVLRSIDALVLDADVQFKWPNDVLIDGRKVAGILLSSRLSPDDAVVVMGTGVNVLPSVIPVDGGSTCLAEWVPEVSIDTVRERLAVELGVTWNAWLSERTLPDRDRRLLEARMAWRGQRVEITLPGCAVDGVVAGLAPDGGLRLHDEESGEMRTLHVGEIARGPRVAARSGTGCTVYFDEQNHG